MDMLNPLSHNYHAWKDLASHVRHQKGIKKVGGGLAAAGIIIASALAGAATLTLGATPAFRLMVKQLIKSSDPNHTQSKVDQARKNALGSTDSSNIINAMSKLGAKMNGIIINKIFREFLEGKNPEILKELSTSKSIGNDVIAYINDAVTIEDLLALALKKNQPNSKLGPWSDVERKAFCDKWDKLDDNGTRYAPARSKDLLYLHLNLATLKKGWLGPDDKTLDSNFITRNSIAFKELCETWKWVKPDFNETTIKKSVFQALLGLSSSDYEAFLSQLQLFGDELPLKALNSCFSTIEAVLQDPSVEFNRLAFAPPEVNAKPSTATTPQTPPLSTASNHAVPNKSKRLSEVFSRIDELTQKTNQDVRKYIEECIEKQDYDKVKTIIYGYEDDDPFAKELKQKYAQYLTEESTASLIEKNQQALGELKETADESNQIVRDMLTTLYIESLKNDIADLENSIKASIQKNDLTKVKTELNDFIGNWKMDQDAKPLIEELQQKYAEYLS